ncbi:hypothetical protein GGF32_002903 [Allomyces javanicus]|nr:hypothetical protein GGF32_002903 [Allomyces javanicus]
MASPTGDAAAAHLTPRNFESWDSDIFGSPAHPLIGPTGVPGYWDRASIAASASTPEDSIRNCTFVTLTPTGHDSTIYYGPTCPPAPHNPFTDPGVWIGFFAPFIVCGAFLGALLIKDMVEAEPDKSEMVDRGNEYVQTVENGRVRWIAVDETATTEAEEGLGEQRGKVQWWRWTESSETGAGSGYMLVDSAGALAPAALAPPEDEEQDENDMPPPYSTKTGSSLRKL